MPRLIAMLAGGLGAGFLADTILHACGASLVVGALLHVPLDIRDELTARGRLR